MTELGFRAIYKDGKISNEKRNATLYHETKKIFETLLESPGMIFGYQQLANYGGSVEANYSYFEEIRIRLSIMRARRALGSVDKRLAKKVKTHHGKGYSWG